MPKIPKITSLQYLCKKEVRNKVNFLHKDKHQSFIEADTMHANNQIFQDVDATSIGKYGQSHPK